MYVCVFVLTGFYDDTDRYCLSEKKKKKSFLIAHTLLKAVGNMHNQKKHTFLLAILFNLLLLLCLQILNYLFHYLFVLSNKQNPYLQRDFNCIQICCLSKETCNVNYFLICGTTDITDDIWSRINLLGTKMGQL